ncbi:MAG: S-layer protein domain-containing protein [Methanosarcinales archaeon]
MRKIFIGLMVICLFVITVAALAPPTDVIVEDVPEDNGNNISINWAESIDTVEGYEIFRATSENGDYDSIGTSVTNSYLDNTTTDGTDYWYKVNATDGINSSRSDPSGPVQSEDNLEPIITDVTNGAVTDSTAIITWTTNENSNSLVEYGTESLSYTQSQEDLEYIESHSINLNNLDADKTYYYVVHSTDEGDNSDQSDEYTFSTTEDITEPEVGSVSPNRNDEDVAIDSNVQVIFSESMDQSTINLNSFYITDTDGKIDGIITIDNPTTATFDPSVNFKFNTQYTVTVTTEVADLAGINMNEDDGWTFTTSANQGPSLTNNTVIPEDGTSPVTFYFYVTYTDDENEPANYVKVFVDGELRTMSEVDISDLTTSDGKKYEYNITLTNEKSYDCYFEASDGTTPITKDSDPKTIKVNSKTYESGNRIWDKEEDMSDIFYTWTPQSFSGFYYNLDTNEGKETLTIKDIDRSIENDDIVYVTEPIVKEFECDDFGNYSVIGFMAERYFAGYEEDSIMNDGFSLLDEEILSRVLIDDDESQMIKSGIPLVLEEGYEFRVTEYAASGDDVMVALFKDGESIYETILSEGNTFTYKKDMGSADDIPIIALHVDTVFRGMETSTISIDGIFQISDDYISVEDGDEFGLMEIDGVDSGQITMVNSNDVSLKKGKTFNLMGKINIEVGNCDELRFAFAVDTSEPGTYELRGTVTQDETYTWTPLNFEGLLYDMDSGDKKETLYIEREGIDDRGISRGDLSYNTSPISMNFEYSGWDDYESIGFMGEKYFAGYEDNSIEKKGVSLMNKGYLGKILIDEDEKHTLYVGNSLPLAEGYSFRIDEISQDGDSIMVALLRDGEEIKSDIINDDSTYTHTKEVDDEDVPVIAIHIDNIFRGMETNSIFVNGIFQISEDFKKIEEGDSYGNMEIDSVTKNYIKMSNDGSMTLGKGDTISIMGDIKIKVADDDTVRFYPFQEIKVEALESLEIDFPNNIYSNQEFTIKVTSDGDEVEGAYVSFGDIEIGATDSNGELVYTPTETGSFNITASKSGYNSDSSEIEVIFQPTALDITFPSVIDKNELLTILVTSEGSPLSGASVMFGSIDLGTTPSSGNISHTPDEIGTFTISASKSGYQDASKDIDISDPSAKLVFTNLKIDPEEIDPGQTVTISVETSNFGTLREAETVILNINEEEESTRDVTLGPGEISTITFSVNKSKSGTYDVEIGGLEGSFKVTGDSSISIIAMILLGIIGLFSVGAIVYSVSKGDLTFDSMTEKASEIEVKIKRLIEK